MVFKFRDQILATDAEVATDAKEFLKISTMLGSIFGGLCQKKYGATDAMTKGVLAQPIIAGRTDVCKELTLLFVSHLQVLDPLFVVEDPMNAIEIEQFPGISISPHMDSQRLAASPDMVIFLKNRPKICMTVEIKFSIDWKNRKKMLDRYVDQCKMQVMVLSGIGGILLVADSSLVKSIADVRSVASICQFVTQFIPRDPVWEQGTRASIILLTRLSNCIKPQLLNSQELTCNPLAPSTYYDAVQIIDDGSHCIRKGRSHRFTDCESFINAIFLNFEILPAAFWNPFIVRTQTGVSTDEAFVTSDKIMKNRTSGLYLVNSNPEHNGCSRPIFVDAQISPEQWSKIYAEMVKLKELQVSNDKIALMLATQFHLVGKTSQDVSNILLRLETEKLAEEGKCLLTNGEELISALDALPVFSIVLFDIVDMKGEKVKQIIRIKGLHGTEHKIAYVEYREWSMLHKEIPHSLLKCYKNHAASSFPITDVLLKPFLYLFSTDVKDQYVKNLNPLGLRATAAVISWIGVHDMEQASLSTETAINDSTCKCCQGNFKYNCTVAQSPDGHTAFLLKSLLTEKKVHFVFLFLYVLPIIYGDLMKLVINVQVDGNGEVFSALQIAIAAGMIGMPDLVPSLCFFHTATQTYLCMYGTKLSGLSLSTHKKYGFRATVNKKEALDGGKGMYVYRWVSWLAYHCTSDEFVQASLSDLFLFIDGKQIGRVHYVHPEEFTDKHKMALLEWVRQVVSHFPRLLKCLNGLVDMHLMTSSLLEGNFRPIKKLSGLNSHSKPAALVHWTESSAVVRQQKNLQRGYRNANAVVTSYLSDPSIPPQVLNVLRFLNPLAQGILLDQLRDSHDRDVYRIEEDRYLVILNESAIASFEKQVVKNPHLYSWKPEHNDVLVQVEKDVRGVRRLRCCCFTCKRLMPCSAIIAIKGGLIDTTDFHFRYLNDYVNGVYPIERSRSDLFDFRGAVFTHEDDERHTIVESPRERQQVFYFT